jgi:outer membrane protein assembly factor BamC
MLKLGASKEQTAQVAVVTSSPSTSTTTSAGGQPELVLADGFDRAWRRVGLALDRTGFTVEDRDRTKGLYFVRYRPSDANTADDSWFKKLFGGASKPNATAKYQISVRSKGDKTLVSVLDAQGLPDVSETAKNLLKVLSEDLR